MTPEWLQMMARYNAWQNAWMLEAAGSLPRSALTEDRGAFFGSILGTLSHLLWGDTIWMSRFDGGPAPEGGIPGSDRFFETWEEYAPARLAMDARIETWAMGLNAAGCEGDISWYSGAMGADVTRPRMLVFTHFFNHQTHHRGQVHAMLTAAGAVTSDTDLFFMPAPGNKED